MIVHRPVRRGSHCRPFAGMATLIAALLSLPATTHAGASFPVPVTLLATTDVARPAGFSGQLLELRVAPGPRDAGTDASTLLHVAALIGGTPGTTLLTGRLGAVTRTDINALPADIVGQVGVFTPVAGVVNAQAFSVGGGCAGNASGSDTLFPIVRNLRWFNVRVNATGSSVEGPFGPTTVHSIDCATTPDRSAVYYFLVNGAAPARGELWRQDSSGVALVSAGFAGLTSPFSGGVRPSIVFGPQAQQATLQYLLNSGTFLHQVINLNTLNALLTCTSGKVNPPPTTFSTVWEGRLLRALWSPPGGAAPRFAAGDFDRNAVAEATVHAANGCGQTLVSKGSAGGGNGYNWVGYSGSADPTRPVGGLLGAGRLVQTNPETGQIEEIPGVPVATGGPIDSVPIRERSTQRTGVLWAQAAPAAQAGVLMRVSAYVYAPDPGAEQMYANSFESAGLAAVIGGNQ